MGRAPIGWSGAPLESMFCAAVNKRARKLRLGYSVTADGMPLTTPKNTRDLTNRQVANVR